MNPISIYVTRGDYRSLRSLLATLGTKTDAAITKLRETLNRAAVVDASVLPGDVVKMDSTVEYEDVGTGEVDLYTVTFPDSADVDRRRISILSPIGTAFLGRRVGDVVNWTTPASTRQLRVRRVSPPVPATETSPLLAALATTS